MFLPTPSTGGGAIPAADCGRAHACAQPNCARHGVSSLPPVTVLDNARVVMKN